MPTPLPLPATVAAEKKLPPPAPVPPPPAPVVAQAPPRPPLAAPRPPASQTEAGERKDPLLSPAPEFPFGANGLAFDRDQRFLYVANTSTRRILRIEVLSDGSAGPAQIFADGDTLNHRQGTTDALVRVDGIVFDVQGNLYVCANVSDEIQVLAPDGSAITTRYTGIGADALDFPASLVFKGRQLFISNLSLNDGGIHSKISVLDVPLPGLPLRP